jgi:hypothetical protein
MSNQQQQAGVELSDAEVYEAWFKAESAWLHLPDPRPSKIEFCARGVIAADRQQRGKVESVADGRLHDDGYFTWNKGKRPAYLANQGLPCDFYLAAPQAEKAPSVPEPLLVGEVVVGEDPLLGTGRQLTMVKWHKDAPPMLASTKLYILRTQDMVPPT